MVCFLGDDSRLCRWDVRLPFQMGTLHSSSEKLAWIDFTIRMDNTDGVTSTKTRRKLTQLTAGASGRDSVRERRAYGAQQSSCVTQGSDDKRELQADIDCKKHGGR